MTKEPYKLLHPVYMGNNILRSKSECDIDVSVVSDWKQKKPFISRHVASKTQKKN